MNELLWWERVVIAITYIVVGYCGYLIGKAESEVYEEDDKSKSSSDDRIAD